MEVKGRRGRRREQPLDGLEETRGYWKFKEEAALGRTVGRTGVGKDCGPVVRQTAG